MTATVTHFGEAYFGVDHFTMTVDGGDIGMVMAMELADTAWKDVTADTLQPITVNGGIMGNGVNDRVASTGALQFDLDNSSTNSASTAGYYSPGHASVRTGFGIGKAVQLIISDGTNTKRIYGRIPPGGIVVTPGQYRERRTHVTAVDWMNQAATYPLVVQELQINKRIDEVVQTILNVIPLAPLATSLNTGQDAFPYAFDTLGTATRAMTEFQKLAESESGYIYIKHDATYGETLTVDSRFSRSSKTSGVTLSNTMLALDSVYGGNFIDQVKITAYPRRVDTDPTTILYSSPKALRIGAGETLTFSAKYRDPTSGSKKIAGTDIQTMVAGTDYIFNTQEFGGGTDITANLDISGSTLGANAAEFVLVNNAASDGYVTTLQVVGKGIYFYDAQEIVTENTALVAIHGEQALTMNQAYQDNINTVQSAADYWLSRLSTAREDVKGVTFSPNRSTALMTAFLSLDIGDRFTLSETITGLSAADYYINGMNLQINSVDNITCQWIPGPLVDATVWFRWGFAEWDNAANAKWAW